MFYYGSYMVSTILFHYLIVIVIIMMFTKEMCMVFTTCLSA